MQLHAHFNATVNMY